MATELDELMLRDPLSLSDQDIDTIIAYQRKQRAMFESGVKGKAKKDTGPAITIDLESLGIIPKAPTSNLRRRV